MMHPSNETLIDYLHRELAPGDDADVLAHVGTCAACACELEIEARIADGLRSAALADARDIPLGMREAIFARIAEAPPTPLERLQGFLRPIVLVPLAAVAAAAAFAVAVTTAPPASHRSGPALPVSYYLEEHAVRAQENPLADRSAAVMMTSLERAPSTSSVPLVQSVNAASMAEDAAR